MAVAPRRRAVRAVAALLAVMVLTVPLLVEGVAIAATAKITKQDCKQGTIRTKSGKPISKARCKRLIGHRVRVAENGKVPKAARLMKMEPLAKTGFDVRPLVLAGGTCLSAAAAVGLRRRRATRAV